MSSSFSIQSTDGARLEFRGKPREHHDESHRVGAFAVALTSERISALCWVHYAELTGWPRFFADLAEQWRGWEGEKARKEFEFEVSCRADGMGHIAMRVVLQDLKKTWRAEATLPLEAGQLAGIAIAAAKYFG